MVETSTTGGDYTKEYVLDLVGNRLTLIETKEGQSPVTTTSIYDARDRLLTEMTGSVTLNYGYNANGSLTTKHEGSVLQSKQAWDVRGRLAGLKDGSGNWLSQYRYTPDGIRSAVTEGATTTLHVIDVLGPSGYAQVIEERTAAGVVVGSYVYGPALDPLSQWRDGHGANLYLADGHSGVRQAVSLAGVVLLAQRFDAFGVTVASAGTLANVIGYRGERFDSTLGQYYLRARFYNPMSGRFTGMDPFAGNYGDPSQAMRYGYAGANPVTQFDPTGLFSVSIGGAFSGGMFGYSIGNINPHARGTGSAEAIAFGTGVSGLLGKAGVHAFKSIMGLPMGLVLGAAVGFYGGFLAGFADALADDPNVSYDQLIQTAIISGVLGAITGILAFGYMGGIGRALGACFAAGTPLLTTDGSKSIEQFRPGDRVLARNEFDPYGRVEEKVVEEVFVTDAQVMYLSVNGQTISTTSEHPFYVVGKGWTAARDLRVGDALASHDTQNAQVEAIEVGKWQRVYNMRVQDHHTYFVGCDEWGFSVWAHNECVYRGMTKSPTANLPMPVPTARLLGVRPGADVSAVLPSDIVDPNGGGMSVAPDNPTNLPAHRRPPSLGGTGKDPVWSIDSSVLGESLMYRRDNAKHGTILPAKSMTLAEFQIALALTSVLWTKVAN